MERITKQTTWKPVDGYRKRQPPSFPRAKKNPKDDLYGDGNKSAKRIKGKLEIFEKYRTIHFARNQIRKTCRGSNQAKGNTHTKILTGTGRSPRIRLPPSLQHDSSIFDIFFSSSLLFLVSLYISHDLFKKRSVRNDECWPP